MRNSRTVQGRVPGGRRKQRPPVLGHAPRLRGRRRLRVDLDAGRVRRVGHRGTVADAAVRAIPTGPTSPTSWAGRSTTGTCPTARRPCSSCWTDFDAHPHTRMSPPCINRVGPPLSVDMSVGFDRSSTSGRAGQTRSCRQLTRSQRGRRGCERWSGCTRSGWDETVSWWWRGAVPGAKVLTGVRMTKVRSQTLEFDDVDGARPTEGRRRTDRRRDGTPPSRHPRHRRHASRFPSRTSRSIDVQPDDGIAEAAEALEALET